MVAKSQSKKAMKCRLVYISSHLGSLDQRDEALESFSQYSGWDVEKKHGVTPRIVESRKEFQWPIKEQSRLLNFKEENPNRYLTKLSCVINHVKFWRQVVKQDQPMAFLEHDAICIGDWNDVEFDEYLILNAEYVFRKPNKLGLKQFSDYIFPGKDGVHALPKNYRLKYYRENDWKGSYMVPGTGAYAITPKGARKMLEVAEKGLDQSDFLLNSHNINIEYLLPSPVKFNNENLSTSYGI